MPGTPRPIVGPLGSHWSAVIAAIQASAQQVRWQNAGSTQGALVDAYGNVVEIYGTNLWQTVTIGASFQQPGVLITTGFAASPAVAGRAGQKNLAIGTITLTKNSTAATLISTTSGTFTNGMLVGAADVSDPSSGVATPAISPGTTMTISGSAITLSQNAAESGTALFAAACNWTLS